MREVFVYTGGGRGSISNKGGGDGGKISAATKTSSTSSCKVILLPCICPYNLSDTLKRVHGSNKELQKPPPAQLRSHSIALHLSFELPSLAVAAVGGHIETRKNDP